MTERRRPLENDDGQGALFGGDAFAPAGPAPAWKRPAPEGDPSSAAPPAPELEPGADAAAAGGSAAGADDPAPFEARVDAGTAALGGAAPGADVAPPTGFGPGAARGLDSGTAVPAGSPSPSPFADEIAELERATDVRAPRSPRAPLAGPTLDDVMSRVWEGLATGLPVACPVCHSEVAPAISGPPRGRCSSCGTTID